MSSDFPSDLKYTDEHEWLRIKGTSGVIGITHVAAERLGDVVAVELPEEGEEVEKGAVFGSVESHKSVSDLFAPVSGKVVRVNAPLNDAPEAVNDDPYDKGWIIELELSDLEQLDELLTADAYRKLVDAEDA